jgi:hypothetical protein
MAKAAIKTPPAAAPAAAAPVAPATPFAITFGDAPPPAAAFGGGRSGEDNPIKKTLLAMQAPAGGKYAYFDIPVSVPDGIIDAGEREKALADKLRKEVNKVSGVARRVSKADASMQFAVRKTDTGVRVWRIEPKAAEPAAPPAA